MGGERPWYSESEGRIEDIMDNTISSMLGRSESSGFQQLSMSFQVLSGIFGVSNRLGRFPFMTSQLRRKKLQSFPKGTVLKNICTSLIKSAN